MGCFIITGIISNSKISDSLILKNKVPLSGKSSRHWKGVVMTRVQLQHVLGKIVFLLTAVALSVSDGRARQIYIFLV